MNNVTIIQNRQEQAKYQSSEMGCQRKRRLESDKKKKA